jgi:hypothetical protein
VGSATPSLTPRARRRRSDWLTEAAVELSAFAAWLASIVVRGRGAPALSMTGVEGR